VTSTVRRAGAFALVGALALVVPLTEGVRPPGVATALAVGPFLVVAALALTVVTDGPLFDLFARPGDRQERTLFGLAGFALAAAGLALLAVRFGLPVRVYVATVFVLAVGNLAASAVGATVGDRVLAAAGFVVGGTAAGIAGAAVTDALLGAAPTADALATAAFLAAAGALLAALLRSVLFERDDPLAMASVGLALWLLADLPVAVSPGRVAVALVVTAGLGYLAYALDTASLQGMLTGVLLSLLTIVLGDFRWFAVLIAFFGLGGLSTKYRYEEKARREIAEPNDGARGSGNVLANSVVALAAVLLAAASPSHTGVGAEPFLYAFAGAVAAALSDTFSSEFGGLFDRPRLITTLEPVDPGTDGAVTWQGEVAGLVGAGLVAGIAALLFGEVAPAGAGVVLAAGVAGMTVDSLLGATVEGRLVGNQGVNLLATLSAAVVAVLLATAI
jgi:uncharacterized protein (TIGR00297 family)